MLTLDRASATTFSDPLMYQRSDVYCEMKSRHRTCPGVCEAECYVET